MRKQVSKLLLVPCFSAALAGLFVLAAVLATIATYVVFTFGLQENFFLMVTDACSLHDGTSACWLSRGMLAIVPALVFFLTFAMTWKLVRCPHCKKTFPLQGKKKSHPRFDPWSPLGPFWSLVIDVLWYKKFRCPKCGGDCRVGKAPHYDVR
jgi:hypothetical protein